jgi:hypothetical protein
VIAFPVVFRKSRRSISIVAAFVLGAFLQGALYIQWG